MNYEKSKKSEKYSQPNRMYKKFQKTTICFSKVDLPCAELLCKVLMLTQNLLYISHKYIVIVQKKSS